MVYMAGDNNLDGAALRDIAEMSKVGSTKDVNVLVQLDRIEDKILGFDSASCANNTAEVLYLSSKQPARLANILTVSQLI